MTHFILQISHALPLKWSVLGAHAIILSKNVTKTDYVWFKFLFFIHWLKTRIAWTSLSFIYKFFFGLQTCNVWKWIVGKYKCSFKKDFNALWEGTHMGRRARREHHYAYYSQIRAKKSKTFLRSSKPWCEELFGPNSLVYCWLVYRVRYNFACIYNCYSQWDENICKVTFENLKDLNILRSVNFI